MWDVTHSYVRRDSFIIQTWGATWLIPSVRRESRDSSRRDSSITYVYSSLDSFEYGVYIGDGWVTSGYITWPTSRIWMRNESRLTYERVMSHLSSWVFSDTPSSPWPWVWPMRSCARHVAHEPLDKTTETELIWHPPLHEPMSPMGLLPRVLGSEPAILSRLVTHAEQKTQHGVATVSRID